MHKYIAITLILFFSVSCQSPEHTTEEIEQVNNTVFRFFDAIKTFDYELLKETCTTDFMLAENGLKMSVEEFIEFLKPFEQSIASIEYQFEDIETRIEGDVAWMSLTNHAVMKTKDDKE